MCNPSSSVERTPEDPTAAIEWAGPSRQLIRQAYTVGPATAWFIDRLWKQAAQEAYWQSLEVFQFARWCSAERVERAIFRIHNRGVGGFTLLRLVLERELDLLDDRADAELGGQLVFPFATVEPTGADRQSGNQDETVAFLWTGSRQSW